MLIAGAMAFNYVITVENIPKTVSAILTATDLSPIGFLLMVNVILLVLGCLLEGTTIILIILPVLLPTATALGIDPVHFGVMAVTNIMFGLVTPPYGLLLFMMTKDRRRPAARHRARGDAVPRRDADRADDHHLHAGLRAVPAAHVRLLGLTRAPERRASRREIAATQGIQP